MNDHLDIPRKSFFKIEELCSITGIRPYVLRFWETEFDKISPVTSSTGQKLYEEKDIQTVNLIKKLLFEEKLTIELARFKLDEISKEEQKQEEVEEKESSLMPLNLSELNKFSKVKKKLENLISYTNLIKEQHLWP